VALLTALSLPSVPHLRKAYQDHKNDEHRLLTFTTLIPINRIQDEPKILWERLLR
jgi:hypothetical protein